MPPPPNSPRSLLVQLQAMIDEFDRDQDGEINEEEFTYIMSQSTND